MPTLCPSSPSLEHCSASETRAICWKWSWPDAKGKRRERKNLNWIMVRIQLFGCWKPLRRYKMRSKKPRHSSIWCTLTLTIDHNHLHTQTLSHVFTCYELECTVVSRWISSDSFLDAVGCHVKQIQVIFHTKTFLEAIFETDITCNPIYTKYHLWCISF